MDKRPCAMVVDREPLAQWALAELAKEAGCTVITANSPEMAARLVRESSTDVDFLLLDCPRTWADLTLASAIKQMRPGCRVVLMVDFGIDAFAARALALGVDQVLIKPVDADEARAILRATDMNRAAAAAPAPKPLSLQIPWAVQRQREHIETQLRRASNEPGAIGDLAGSVQRLLETHALHEEQYALPPLGLLPLLAAGFVWPEMRLAVAMSASLASNLPQMLDDHEALIAAAKQLEHIAEQARRPDLVSLALALVQHAELEAEVLYPAAVLTGEFVAMKLALDGTHQPHSQ